MRKLAFVVLLLAACGRKHQGPAAPAPLTIAITREGVVKLEGKAVTLDELGALLAARREAGPREEFYGVNASALPVLLDLEDDALWGHVSWVMTVLAEQKFWRLSLPGGRDVPLPGDCGITICREPDGVALLVRILVLENGEYAFGNRTTRDARDLGTWIDAAPRDGMLCRIGELREEPCATWRLVRPAFDVLRARGMKSIDFTGAIPPRSERVKSPLPAPLPRTETRGWSGLRVVDYWSDEDTYEGWHEEDPGEPVRPEEEMGFPEEQLLKWLNGYRREVRLLVEDDTLRKAATAHAGEMNRMGYFGHFSPVPGNHSPSDRLAKLGWHEERRHVEILAKAETAEAALTGILAKPENAAILADPVFRYAGVAQSGDCWVVLLGAEK